VPRRLALIALSLAGCTSVVTLGQDDPRVYPDGATIVHCGPVDCEPGTICCDAHCGICASERGCPSVSPGCSDSDAAVPRACSATDACAPGYFCERRSCTEDHGLCTRIPDGCTSFAPIATCGCDGLAYRSSCDAQHAGQTSTFPTCGVCNPPSVTLTSGCTSSLGWAWNGAACVGQIGCACSGACDALAPSQSECTTRYGSVCAPWFPCGQTSCRRDREYCLVDGTTGACVAAPTGCSTLDCACVASAGLPTTSCTDDGHGGIRATL